MPAEPTHLAGGVDPALYPVAVLIDELGHDDRQTRLRSIRSLGTIATALGPERTREELLPFLQDVLDDEDELQAALAEELGRGVPWVGGPRHAHALAAPLEELCSQEEISVREKAVESLKGLIREMDPEADPQVPRHVCSLLSRLAGSHDWFTSRMSACGLFAVALPKVSGPKQDDLFKAYARLCGDDTPMVRRQAASVLGEVASVVPQESMLAELVEVFEKLCRDEQESVRILAISNCVALGRLQPSAERQAQIFPVVESCAQDKSWRVRYVMAEHVHTLCEVFHTKATHIVPLYLQLLQDQEVEVRTMAAARIAGVSKVKPDKDFLETLIPVMEKLTAPRERSHHVRAALAGAVLSLSPVFGPSLTVDYLVNIFLHLIKDESADVRLKLIGTLGELSAVMGIDVLSQSLLPCIKELGRDRQWRVRRMVIDSMPSLAKYLGPAKFTEELSGLFVAWLEDPVCSVRDAIAVNFRLLYVELGTSWCETHVVPRLQALLAHGNYLYRISAVLCAGRLAEVAAREFLDKHLVPLVVKLAADPVPNVCFNTAKVIQAMQPFAAKTSPTVTESHLIPCLRRQAADADPDVKFYARRALTEMGVP
mmetsp:Transcript_68580/g.185262  ORF Transcript_68580/g.185262 Transcript_68580/m.185262 type:complete len:599 (-) Transcript_68580:68-1864(-)